MIDALIGIITGQGGLAAAFGGFLVALAAFAALLFKARREGAKSARDAATLNAAIDRLEMDREATAIERAVGEMTDAEITARLKARARS